MKTIIRWKLFSFAGPPTQQLVDRFHRNELRLALTLAAPKPANAAMAYDYDLLGFHRDQRGFPVFRRPELHRSSLLLSPKISVMLLFTGAFPATSLERNVDCAKWPPEVFKAVLTSS
jgi:hypothetical protein